MRPEGLAPDARHGQCLRHRPQGWRAASALRGYRRAEKTEWALRIFGRGALWPLPAQHGLGLQTLRGRETAHSEGAGLMDQGDRFPFGGIFHMPVLLQGPFSCWFFMVLIFSTSLLIVMSSCSINCWEMLLKSPSLIVGVSVSDLSSIGFRSTRFQALMFGTYRFRIAVSSWSINPFIVT